MFLFLRLENKINYKNIEDIDFAERKLFMGKGVKLIKIISLLSTFIILSLITFILKNNVFIKTESNTIKNKTSDERILGHFPYKQTANNNLIEIEPNIFVHKDMYEALLKMKKDAQREGVYLVFLSGYRSIKLQKEIFYSLKSLRNQNALERARVSAPPGYSEHSTGFAIDIGDANNPQTDFEVGFEKTDAFLWLKDNAAKYHFRLSFNKKQNSVDYEPWHWRYEGSIEALRIFESSNKKNF